MNIVKNTCQETPEVPLKKITTTSVEDETSDIPVLSRDDLHAETKCEHCGFGYKSNYKKTPYDFTIQFVF